MAGPGRDGSDAGARVFSRILCGIDGTPESVEAARQAARLGPADARIVLAAVPSGPRIETIGAGAGWAAPAAPLVSHEQEARDALELARRALGAQADVTLEVLVGDVVPALLAEAELEEATLIAVGSHGHGRAGGIATGSVATTLLHEAPCSVLLARAAPETLASIAVGYDGSPPATAALAVARSLAARSHARLRVIVAGDHERAMLDRVRDTLGETAEAEVIEDDRDPVTALVQAGAGLLVVGSRGLHGLRSLGSVGERVAHRAPCSVLVVREPGSARAGRTS